MALPPVTEWLHTLTFKWKGNVETNYDYLDINYSLDGVKWTWVDYRTGTTGGSFTSDSTTEFTDLAEMYNIFYFGFGMSTDTSIIRDGVYIDDVKLIRQQLSISNYSYTNYNGTSMAAPHVSGVAGLIKAFNPGLTNIEIKNAILNNVDAVSSLSGKVLTGGRINAFKALSSVFVDNDGDGIADSQDNCSQTFNPGQQDTDSDGYGNICDADLDNDGVVGFMDFNIFKAAWLSTALSPNWNPDADLDSDNVVGFQDFNVFKGRWLTSAPWK